jgi:hypothetical protein
MGTFKFVLLIYREDKIGETCSRRKGNEKCLKIGANIKKLKKDLSVGYLTTLSDGSRLRAVVACRSLP